MPKIAGAVAFWISQNDAFGDAAPWGAYNEHWEGLTTELVPEDTHDHAAHEFRVVLALLCGRFTGAPHDGRAKPT